MTSVRRIDWPNGCVVLPAYSDDFRKAVGTGDGLCQSLRIEKSDDCDSSFGESESSTTQTDTILLLPQRSVVVVGKCAASALRTWMKQNGYYQQEKRQLKKIEKGGVQCLLQ
jgi:hypothetical protein